MGDSKQKTLLVVGAGPAQVDAVRAAKRMGYKVVAVDGDSNAPGLKYADVAINIDVRDIAEVNLVASKYDVDAVMSVSSDACLKAVAAVNESLGLAGLSLEQVELISDKGAVRERLHSSGISGPPFKVFRDEDDLSSALGQLDYPCVVKPVDNAGSRGVYYVSSKSEIGKAFTHSMQHSRVGRVIVEGFIPGTEVALDAIVHKGSMHILSISDKFRTAPPYLLDTAVMFPTAYSGEIRDSIVKTGSSVIEALGLDECPIHMELIIDSGRAKVVEVAARGAGFKVYSDILPYVCGVNGIELQVKMAFGIDVDVQSVTDWKGACIMFFGSDKEGVVRNIENVDEATALPGIHEVQLYVNVGDRVRELRSGSDRFGHVIAFAEHRGLAVERARKAYDMVCVELG